ncbi:MAG: exo-alpha-sialidase [Firmicutes bacterium]|nr:exo-alpha-sialidase [Bacillota bacterium]
MLITDPNLLKQYNTPKRLWQGIPSIEVTPKGRIFLTFYAGGIKEQIGNFAVVIKSDDGVNFSEPIAAMYEEGHRCYDSCLWIDPLGRLWLTWARSPHDGVFGSICDDPDADELVWGPEFFIGNNIMMNKPTVVSTGEWLFPIAVWNYGIRSIPAEYDSPITPKLSFAYRTTDYGKTFEKLGGADVENRHCDEHMILELQDGTLRMFVRTQYGIGYSDSTDGGLTWGPDFDSGYGGPCSRFFIRRLTSGRILLINHHKFCKRNNLTAMLSEDDGKTFPYKLRIDERDQVSYPDAKQVEDGSIYITYDRERGAYLHSMEDVMNCAREILLARITEEDIMNGALTSEGSFLKRVANKLGEFDGEDPFAAL